MARSTLRIRKAAARKREIEARQRTRAPRERLKEASTVLAWTAAIAFAVSMWAVWAAEHGL